MIKKCEFCGKEFEIAGNTPNERRRKYCDGKCRVKANNNRTNKKRKLVPLKQFFCSVCNTPYWTNRSDSMTCSKECRYERDKQLTRERYHKEIGISNKFLEDYKKERQKPKKVVPAHEIEAEARKLGMHYGTYTAMLYMQAQKGE